MAKRNFLEFGANTFRDGDLQVNVYADVEGCHAILGKISFRDFANKIGKHVKVVDCDGTENEKLLALSELWRDISPEIGGYLFGDICYDPDSSTCFKR